MNEHLTKVTRKGQITVPLAVRRALGFREGDSVAVTLGGGGRRSNAARASSSARREVSGASDRH